jgi:FHS family L-fucose permease-like MFS transporter
MGYPFAMPNTASPPAHAHLRPALALIYLAFFTLGMVGSMTGALVPALRVIYRLDFRTAMAAQWLVLVVSGTLALPVLHALERLGAFRTICAALAVLAIACGVVAMAIGAPWFALVLAGLAILAVGTTALQVSGNPMVTALVDARESHSRLALAQAFNSLGVLGGVNLGATVMLGKGGSAPNLTAGVTQAYGMIAAFTLAALAMFVLGRRWLPAQVAVNHPALSARRWPRAGPGRGVGIALYVGAEGAIGSVLINFLHQPDVLGLSLGTAGSMVANLYWGGALAGRFAGSWLLTRFPPRACWRWRRSRRRPCA